jgi:hypothetical protein
MPHPTHTAAPKLRCLMLAGGVWASLALVETPLLAQLVCYDGFGDYADGIQLESGPNGSSGAGLDAGAGWGGPYDVSNAIKSLVKTENRSSNPVIYSNGGISINGGNRALRFYDIANGSYALQRPLGKVFKAAAGETLWFSVLFRTASGGASPLANQDFVQIGFDDNPSAAAGVPRVSIGSNTTQTTYPAPYRFFARSTAAPEASVFHDGVAIAAATTYLLVGRIHAQGGTYDTVSLFVNPSDPDQPGPPSAEIVLSSGLRTLSHAFIRTVGLDSGDAYVFDEWHVGRDYGSVVQALQGSLRVVRVSASGEWVLRWPVAPANTKLATSTSLAPDSWSELTGPFPKNGAEWELPLASEPGAPRRFFQLGRGN